MAEEDGITGEPESELTKSEPSAGAVSMQEDKGADEKVGDDDDDDGDDDDDNDDDDSEEDSEQDSHDGTVCDACGDDASYEDNPILLCDGCDVAVHIGCYGIKVVFKVHMALVFAPFFLK